MTETEARCWVRRMVVSVAAASISISPPVLPAASKLPSAVTRCLPLPLPLLEDEGPALSFAAFLDFDFPCVSGVRAAFGGRRGERVGSIAFSGAVAGGSSGL